MTVEVTVAESELTIGDVCQIRGGTAQARTQIASLDLDELLPGKPTTVSKQQVAVRIALAGISRKSFELSGPNSIDIRLIENEQLQQRIESKIAAELSLQFGIPQSDVRVRLLDTAALKRLRKSVDTTSFKTMAYFPTQLPLGDRHIQLEFSDSSGNQMTEKMHVQIVVLHDVLVTSGVVSKGTVITAEHVQQIKRPLLNNKVDPATIDCLGCTVSRDIAPHEIVTLRHISRKPTRKQIVVKRNDLVDILLVQGPLRLRLKNAKVMTNGGKGDVVRVLNTNSNKEINAVVQDRTTVLVKN